MLSGFKQWLRRVPITDPVDRRNAPILQGFLLLLGTTLPLAWAFFIATSGMPPDGEVALAIAMAISLIAFACIALIRRGRFRFAIVMFLGIVLVLGEIAYLRVGFQAQLNDQIAQILVLVIGGLVLGRRGLWWVFAALLVVVASGIAVDAHALAARGEPMHGAFRHVMSVVFSYLGIAIVLDRTVTALRESLDESNARGRELQREMAERERAQEQLVHAQKMEATGRLASGIAHDFNTVLDVVAGFASQRHDDGAPAAERTVALEQALEGVEIAARRGAAISRKLLRFGRNDTTRIETFDAAAALDELQPMLRQLFAPGIALDIAASSRPLPVRMDRSQFELMVLSIAANARDAMGDSGRFSIEASRAREGAGDWVGIALSDTGHGMDAATAARIFDAFYSTKAADSGTGLGLSVVRDLVEQAQGRIAVHSAPGQGARLVVHLPRAG